MPWKQNYTISDETSLADGALRWPGGAQCCVSITVDLSQASSPAGITPADLKHSWSYFGLNEGLDLLLATLKQYGLRATFAVPAVIAAFMPDRIRAIQAAGHEIAAEGLRHEDTSQMSMAEEQARIERAAAILESVTGQRPAGWYSLPRQRDAFAVGTISANTVELLREAGYSYLGNGLADDIPHWWVTNDETRTALLTMPYYYHYDDQWFCMFPLEGTGLEHPDMMFRNLAAEFRAQYRRGRQFHMTLHPQHIGWCSRLAMLEQFCQLMQGFPGLWNPTNAELAAHWHAAHPAETQLLLQPSVWRDYPGSLS
jgi:peptidoglycan/xylan/chitin deacetylase (PgdA/CDA1 family)